MLTSKFLLFSTKLIRETIAKMKVGNTMNIRMAAASKYSTFFLLFKHRRMIIVFEVKIKYNIVFLCIDYKLRRHSSE